MTSLSTAITIDFPTPPPSGYPIIEAAPFEEVNEDNWDLFIEYWQDTRCPDCNGIDPRYCPTCKGKGEIQPTAH